MKSIAIFNNKGGVGKTTFLCNLAAALSHYRAKKVLVVDADPQCNATQYMFPQSELFEIYDGAEFTLRDVVKPLAQGKGFVEELSPRVSARFEVEVIPGDPAMSLEEDKLATDWVQGTGGDIRGLRTTFLFSPGATAGSSSSVKRVPGVHCWASQQWHTFIPLLSDARVAPTVVSERACLPARRFRTTVARCAATRGEAGCHAHTR